MKAKTFLKSKSFECNTHTQIIFIQNSFILKLLIMISGLYFQFSLTCLLHNTFLEFLTSINKENTKQCEGINYQQYILSTRNYVKR